MEQLLTMVVSWIEPKLLMKMFTLSSTGIPAFRERKRSESLTQSCSEMTSEVPAGTNTEFYLIL